MEKCRGEHNFNYGFVACYQDTHKENYSKTCEKSQRILVLRGKYGKDDSYKIK